jgi:AraC-like DNA-binding protein
MYLVSYNPTDEYLDVPIVPDGNIYIIYKNGNIVISGLTTSAYILNIAPEDYFFVIQFKANVLNLLLEKDASMYKDKSIELKYVNRKLENEIRTIIENSNEPYNDLDKFFETFFLYKNINEILLKSLQLIEQSQGNIPVLDLANEVGVHPKKLERLFIKSLGVSVKKFSKIKRLGEMHSVLSEQGMVNIVDTILDKGYFDQAHFNRDFKKLTGVTPSSKLMSILYKT